MATFYKPLLDDNDLHIIVLALDELEDNLQYNDEESESEREENETAIESALQQLSKSIIRSNPDLSLTAKNLLKRKARPTCQR
jgi:hypothetical protein